jgi:hypothetical protein
MYIGLQDFAQSACYTVHHLGLIASVTRYIPRAYQAWSLVISVVNY